MRRNIKNLAAVMAVGLLSACSIAADRTLSQVDAASAGGGDFASTLFTGYGDLARSEFAEYDFADSNFFSGKALSVAAGNIPAPQRVEERAIPDDHIAELGNARSRLMVALDGGGADAAPVDAANAQTAYDCWMQEQEEDIQPDDIAACKARFETAIAAVEDAMSAAAPVAPVAAAEPSVYAIFFDFNSDAITSDAQAVIDSLIDRAGAAAKIDVAGHTDLVGTENYNLELSERRADNVRAALIAGGVDGGKVGTNALGESDPAIQTDGKERANRRAVITINP